MARINFTDNELASPRWAGDFTGRDRNLAGGAKVEASQFYAEDSVLVTTTAQASADDVSISVAALSGAIPNGTILYFGESKELAYLTAAAAAGATSLTVQALPSQIESGDTARYAGAGALKKILKSGTLLGRTYAERDANTGFGPLAVGDDEIAIALFDTYDLAINNEVEIYRPGGIVYEDLLPDWSTINTAVNEVQTVVIAGTLSAGTIAFYDPRSGKTSRGVAYNGNLAAIQTALDDIYGASNSVAAGTIASFTITFAVDLAGIDMPAIVVQPSGLTGMTSITVSETTKGGKPLRDLIRGAYEVRKGIV